MDDFVNATLQRLVTDAVLARMTNTQPSPRSSFNFTNAEYGALAILIQEGYIEKVQDLGGEPYFEVTEAGLIAAINHRTDELVALADGAIDRIDEVHDRVQQTQAEIKEIYKKSDEARATIEARATAEDLATAQNLRAAGRLN